MDPDQAQQNVGPDQDQNCLHDTLMVFLKEFSEKVDFEKKSANDKKKQKKKKKLTALVLPDTLKNSGHKVFAWVIELYFPGNNFSIILNQYKVSRSRTRHSTALDSNYLLTHQIWALKRKF